MNYRREIDGLRAVAVLPVIFFHAGFDAFKGGYVGVDVFFVISGYLITNIILGEKEAGTFSLLRFYERRVRRILPALFTVMGACLLPAWLWMMPEKLEDFGESLMAVVLFISNLLFWHESDYFGPDAEDKPLLHTWSLAVEEQYYVVYPLTIMLLWFLGRRRLGFAMLLAALASLALSEWAWRHHPSANFYLAPTRAWELLLGGMVALAGSSLAAAPGLNGALRQAASASGLAMIAYAVFRFDAATPVPGLPALLPTAGTALILAFANQTTLAGRLLSARLPVGLGLISYSAYLWHQPLFAFARLRSPGELSASFYLLLSAAALALAALSWRFVEMPFRDRKRMSRTTVFKVAAISSLLLFAAGLALDASKGARFRYNPEQKAILSLLKYPELGRHYQSGSCFIGEDRMHDGRCHADLTGKTNAVLVWGDSHAASLHMGIFDALGSAPKAHLSAAGCPPLLDYQASDRAYCRSVNDRVFEVVRQAGSPVVILHANWRRYAKDARLIPALEQTLIRLKQVGAKVVLVGSLPQWRPSLPEIVAGRMYQHDLKLAELPRLLPSNRHRELAGIDARLAEAARRQGAAWVSLLDSLCEDGQCAALMATEDGIRLTAWDYGHLTYEGSLLAGAALVARMRADAAAEGLTGSKGK